MEQTEWKRYAVIGGDRRQAYLAEALAANGDFTDAIGFDGLSFPKTVRKVSPDEADEAIAHSSHILLPLPVSRDGITINAPFAARPIPMDDALAERLKGKMVFAGQTDRLPNTAAWQALQVRDYYRRESVQLQNAALTAEGAIVRAMSELPVSLIGLRCLVTGCGRIGKQLAERLRDLGATVSVAARRSESLAWIRLARMRPVRLDALAESGEYALIFNTVPSLIWRESELTHAAVHAVMYELASAPYGIDFEAAKRLNIPVTVAEGIPGKYAPKTAAEMLRATIREMETEMP